MQVTRRRILATAGVVAVGTAARANPPIRAVVELFTSQGCSSCPPADRLLGVLSQDPGLVVLSLPVDYWDSLGWKDSFAQSTFTRRQRAYARTRGDGEVYTPQAVVDGRAIAVGSDRGAILSLIDTLPVSVTMANGVATVENAPAAAILVWAPYLRARTVAIGRGENASAKVTYTNIVRDLRTLGTINGGSRFRVPDLGDAEGGALLVQEGTLDRPGRILGAAQTAGQPLSRAG